MALPLTPAPDPAEAARAFSEQTSNALEVAGVRLVGFTPENGVKLLLTLGFIIGIIIAGRVLRALATALARQLGGERPAFWARQLANLLTAVILLVAVISIWFDDPTRLATALGLVTAGLAFALRQVITAVAGYFTILRGKTFNVGDRIVMGGVRGDVVSLLVPAADHHHGDGPAALGAKRRSSPVGARATIYRADCHRFERQDL